MTKIRSSTQLNIDATLDAQSHLISNVLDPVGAQDAVTKSYADAAIQGIDLKGSCRLGSTVNLVLSGVQTIDGVAGVAGNRIVVKDQVATQDNGLYVMAAGAWSRTTDADTSAEVTPGLLVIVEEGATNNGTAWMLTTAAPITLGVTGLTFTRLKFADVIQAGAGMTRTGDTLDVVNGGGLVANANDLALAWVPYEVPAGAINSANQTFTLAFTPWTGILLYLNGVAQAYTADYTRVTVTITMVAAPLTGDTLWAAYFKT